MGIGIGIVYKGDMRADVRFQTTGTYDPIPKTPLDNQGPMWKDVKLDSTRAKYWLGVGAQPSDSAWRLLSMVSSGSSFLGIPSVHAGYGD